ncbi:MAG: S24/S26 family peptidase [Myxococcales bacterium]|nr:S24/S26 family peptidase [Polyangiaceae bacterium]MDW8249995.1 S24/S26 family peptidase [Myxococcales bacterium]
MTEKPAALLLEQAICTSLKEGRSVTILALGGSMFPTILPGTQLRLEPHPTRRPIVGDLVVVGRPDGGIAIHRAVRVNQAGEVLTWGDALPTPDGWGYTSVLAWPRILWIPWQPSAWTLWKGNLRVQAHLLSASLPCCWRKER